MGPRVWSVPSEGTNVSSDEGKSGTKEVGEHTWGSFRREEFRVGDFVWVGNSGAVYGVGGSSFSPGVVGRVRSKVEETREGKSRDRDTDTNGTREQRFLITSGL